jgi:ubiquinone/menaquinone biosynthesis C-methylase UbiE
VPDLAKVYRDQAADAALGEHWSGPPVLVDRLASLLGTSAGDTVLDVGSGIGGPARRLAELTGCRVVGVDVVEPILREAGRRSRGTAGSPRFVAGSAQALPIGEARVDQVWALGLVAHVPRIDAFARETVRALRPGGVVAVTEVFWDGSRPPRFGASAPQPWRPLTEGAVAAALGAAGLDAVRVLPWPGHGSPGALEPSDSLLRRDLADGRLVPGLLTARKPSS